MYRKLMAANVLLCLIILVSGCDDTDVVPDAVPPVSTSALTGPTYIVQRGKVTRKLEFDGRIWPIKEVPLYFKTLGYVKRVHVKQGDQVKAGDLLAELETDDLQNLIAQAEVALSSAQLLLSEAEKSLERQRALAELNLEVAQTRLTQAERANVHAITQAEPVLELAQEELVRLTQAEDANAYAVTQAELALVLAREELSRTKSLETTYTSGIVYARVGLEQAQDRLARAEIEYQEVLDRPWEHPDVHDSYARDLQQAKWVLEIAQAQYDEALANMEVYRHDLRSREIVVRQAEQELGHLKEAADLSEEVYQSELKIQEIAVKQARAELAHLKEGVDPLLALGVRRAQLELDWLEEEVDPILVNDVSQAQLALEQLQGRVADAQIVAPVDGQVVSLSLYPGRPVEPFRAVVVIADPLAVEVSASLSSDQLKDLTQGQQAIVTPSAGSDRTWTGIILRLPYPYGTGSASGSLADSDQSVRIGLEGDTSDLKPGDLVHCAIVLQEKDNVLWLPPAAIGSFQNRTFVVLQDGGRQRRVDVELGVEGQSRVEILSGLEEGQVVVAP